MQVVFRIDLNESSSDVRLPSCFRRLLFRDFGPCSFRSGVGSIGDSTPVYACPDHTRLYTLSFGDVFSKCAKAGMQGPGQDWAPENVRGMDAMRRMPRIRLYNACWHIGL